ncbi:NAD(P)H-hydrate dehydratase [Leptolyngbya sp. FACHB-711]|uniref:NAD(P)H-hydrate dehydratase n=1 Tax=Leptolyngbya sp. FACHB-711 TaxID=2692813 RepID=UPI0016851101|nr:NAD(P)H-hydrate dehydratase [Leptolyngbya sp. FACHB-711]MBD2025382.1 NAD(P)H-hydrate dehydratase [Leptolyngbya sp. FACHB-711]
MTKSIKQRSVQIQQFVVTAAQMSQIEGRMFAAGMPVAALMEKVAGRITQRLIDLYPLDCFPQVGILVGPGHNGGDALVVARELHLRGYRVICYQPIDKLKELTDCHARYAASLGIPTTAQVADLQDCDLIVDGLFGFGLTRSIEGELAAAIQQINQGKGAIVSIDLPSGLHTDTGAALGTAICADYTFCLGLWKRAFLQDAALAYTGTAELIDFGLPLADIYAILGDVPALQRILPAAALAALPLPRPAVTHKYKQGHLLLIAGSRCYSGAALLAGLAARASGVGMLSIAVPEALKPILVAQLPDALIIGCPEDETGAIAHLPEEINLSQYQTIACGPGLTPEARSIVSHLLNQEVPLLLDADGLNILSGLGATATLQERLVPTVLTPHWGEFKRLFPEIAETHSGDSIAAVQAAAQASGAIVLLKGARTAIGNPAGQVWLTPDSTPALARGGSGDVLTGLMGGLLAQGRMGEAAIEAIAVSAAWWHAQAGIWSARDRTELGVDPVTLAQSLSPTLQHWQQHWQKNY